MRLDQLQLNNFRSYKKTIIDFSPATTVIVGPNASGKTNILEAVFLLSHGKSFRAEKETDMLFWESEVGRIKSQITDSASSGQANLHDQKDKFELEIIITTGQVLGERTSVKKFLLNGVAKRQIDFVGNLKTVLFWPQDLELVTDSPSLRRRYLDFVLSQVDREYRRTLSAYEKGLRQRNKLLLLIRDGQAEHNQLLFWDHVLIKNGNYLTQKRQELVEFINTQTKPLADFQIKYDLSVISQTRLKQYENEEVAAGATLVGPHRDDLIFYEKGRDLSNFGSRGEQRLAVLWLKLAEIDYIEKTTQTRPTLLLDDIFSELDHQHREEVVKLVSKRQTILTTTDRHFLPESLVSIAKMIELGK